VARFTTGVTTKEGVMKFACRLGNLLAATGISIGIWLVMASLVRAWWSLGSPGLRIVALALAGFAGSLAWMAVLLWQAAVLKVREWWVVRDRERCARETAPCAMTRTAVQR
jgi:hypothetical protein